MDVVSLNLCQDEDLPVRMTGKVKAPDTSETGAPDVLNQIMELQQNQHRIMQELNRLNGLLTRAKGERSF